MKSQEQNKSITENNRSASDNQMAKQQAPNLIGYQRTTQSSHSNQKDIRRRNIATISKERKGCYMEIEIVTLVINVSVSKLYNISF